MSTFTDDDLRQLKEDSRNTQIEWLFTGKMKALIARLEAAENSALDVPALCKEFDYCEEMNSYSQTSLDALERHNEWLIKSGRKVAGK